MGTKTAIEYADSTVNPIMGCTGCELLTDHCYARRLCNRYARCKGWPKDFTSPEHFPGRLERAIGWRTLTGTKRPDKPWLDGMPRIIFVNDLSDGFCPGGVAPDEWLGELVPALADSPHVLLFLTKWPGRMRRWMNRLPWVPDNFWLGTTVMRQSDTWRIDELLQIRGGKKWLSCEPLLGAVDPTGINKTDTMKFNSMTGYYNHYAPTMHGSSAGCPNPPKLDWVITGGETGPGARPSHPDWARGLRDQCQAAGVPYFFKSWGEWQGVDQSSARVKPGTLEHVFSDGTICFRVGSKRAGSLLDGIAWRQMPGVIK